MPAPSEPAPPVRVGTPAQTLDAVTRSHLGDGRVVGWYGRAGVVLDAELLDQAVPAALAARFGSEDFWVRWTRAECAAKLADVPIVVWLRRHGLAPPPVVRTWCRGGIVVSLASAVTDDTWACASPPA